MKRVRLCPNLLQLLKNSFCKERLDRCLRQGQRHVKEQNQDGVEARICTAMDGKDGLEKSG